MTEAQATATSFEGQRISITTSRSFDDVLARLRQLIGTDSWSSTPAAMQELGGANQANFEAIVRSRLGPSEFMLFHEINHSQWLPIYGIKRRVLRLIFGNPIIAFTMMRDDLTAGLFAPVEILSSRATTQTGAPWRTSCHPPSWPQRTPRCCQPPVNSTGNSTPSSVARQASRAHRQPVHRRAVR
jgi:hypothetical protein